MIIDIILDRKDDAINYTPATHLKAIYDYATDARMMDLAAAVDGGTEDDVKAALMCYISTCGYPLDLLDYIASVRWTDDAPTPARKGTRTMNNQIKLEAGETLTWAIYENGSGVLSLVLFAETVSDARPVAAVFDILPKNILPALADLEMISMWEGVNYDPADIDTFLKTEATRPVAYSSITTAGEVETIMEEERMGWCARRAFNISESAE